MRVFVYEWSCCVPDAPASLRREGWAMLWRVLHDFERSRKVETVTLIHDSYEHLPPGEVYSVRSAAEEEELFRDLAAGADATLVIAPETGNLLEGRARLVEEVSGQSLGSTGEAIALTADKLRCGQLLRQNSIPTPAVHNSHETAQYPAVLKPRDGAGSQATFLLHSAAELATCMRQAEAESGSPDLIVQDYVPGHAASVAFLLGPKLTLPLPAASQLISDDGRFHYLGGTLPIASPLATRAVTLARRAIDAIPGLRGYVGVDLVLGEAADGTGDWVIEINPRLTTSYLGLSMLAQDNLAMAMLRVTLGQPIGKLRWRQEVVRFAADGGVEIWPAPG
jgi:tyramine---L-glutamate ligase